MSLISAGELASIQSIAQSGMTGTATILTRAIVVTDDGQESVWATLGEDVVCWVFEHTRDSATLGAVAGVVAIAEVFSVRIPIGSAARSGDRLAVGDVIYDIQTTSGQDTYPAWLNCTCRAIEGG